MSGPPDLTVRPLEGYPRAVGAALWMLEDVRRRTLGALEDLEPRHLDALPAGFDNSIGALLYHVAAIEADWLYADILERPFPEWVMEAFPDDVRTPDGRLVTGAGASLAQHLDRLALVRHHLLEELRRVSEEEFRRRRSTESGLVTPEWVLHHLAQHEAEHRGQMQAVRVLLESGS